MGAQSKIEWTDSTFNPWVGCTKVARARGAPSACDFCYAEKWAKRSGQVQWGDHSRRRTTEAYWRNPLTWNGQVQSFQSEHGRRQRVFCASLADVFDNQIDPQWRADLFNLIRARSLIPLSDCPFVLNRLPVFLENLPVSGDKTGIESHLQNRRGASNFSS